MTAQTLTLTDFLLARIAEDEEVAVGARERIGREQWWVDGPSANSGKFWVYATGEKFNEPIVAEHIARHDPARVLAECDAKRRIVERAQRASQAFDQSINPTTSGVAMTMDLVLADLAAVYADHPDYNPDWRP